MKEPVKIVLRSGKDQSVRRYHPWVFSGAIKKIGGNPADGDLVDVYSNKNEFLGRGHYQQGAIAVRILTFEDVEPDKPFWRKKLEYAYQLRQLSGLMDDPATNMFRLVNAEGDGVPGLIMDYYNGTVVFQAHSIGMYLMKDIWVECLQDVLGSTLKSVYNKSNGALPYYADVQPEDGFLYGEAFSEGLREHGCFFDLDWDQGQKTGFYLDQRENRHLLEHYAGGKKVLNVFSYTGGFSVYAVKGGASQVCSVDSSESAIQLGDKNLHLNFDKGELNHHAIVKDAFTFLQEIETEYEVIILDPPSFAKHKKVVPNALQGYKKLNAAAIAKIKPGGLLFTFSCSQPVQKEDFRRSVFTAAANQKRNVQVLHQLTQPADHPVNIFHPEGEYLKGLVVRVE